MADRVAPHDGGNEMIGTTQRKALVIGSEGNIGAPLVSYLRSVGYSVLESDIRPGWRENYIMADINHPVDLLPAFDCKPDVVFLLASTVGRMTCEQAGALAITTNLGGTANVLELCKRAGSMCVFFSSSEVYGPGCDLLDDTKGVPHPNNRYGLSKWLGEQLVEYEVRHSGLRAATIRPCMIYDEDEDIGEHRSAMVRFASNLARGNPIEVHAGSERSWLHVTDAVRAIEAAAHLEHYAVINLGHPEIISMLNLAKMMCRELDADPDLIRIKELPPQMTLVKRPTLERQRTLLGFEPAISIAEGVRRVCARHKRLATSAAATAAAATSAAFAPASANGDLARSQPAHVG
jgi:nucleoside-diphosphate-sugar epimerase